jgi:glycosyltransferase involved in cell wall biosynthesis
MVKKVNEGLLLSRKSGVEIALGEYVSFIDGDDFVKGNALENVLHALDDQPVSDIYHSSFITIKEGREALSRVFDQGHTNGSYLLDKLITSGFGGVFGFFFKRGELNSLTWWNDSSKEGRVSIGEDKFLLLQLLNKRNSIICLDPDLSYYCYIKHAASMTSKHR